MVLSNLVNFVIEEIKVANGMAVMTLRPDKLIEADGTGAFIEGGHTYISTCNFHQGLSEDMFCHGDEKIGYIPMQ